MNIKDINNFFKKRTNKNLYIGREDRMRRILTERLIKPVCIQLIATEKKLDDEHHWRYINFNYDPIGWLLNHYSKYLSIKLPRYLRNGYTNNTRCIIQGVRINIKKKVRD